MRRWIAWHLIFRLQEWAKGHPTFDILRAMEAADRLPAAELEQLQRERLREFIDYCYAHVPHVRSQLQAAGVDPTQIRAAEDLRRLPITRKSDIREHRERLRSDIASGLSSFTTGGSTGEPLVFDIAKRRTAARVACRQRVDRWWGLSVGDPEFALWGSPVELTRQDRLRGVRDWLLATRLLPAFEMNAGTVSHYIDLIDANGCRQIFGYPSAIYLLCCEAKKQRRPLRGLGIKAVFVTGEVLLPYQRDLIAETLNCPVANGYGGRDSGFIAHECPQGGMHILADATIVEIVGPDGRTLPPGESGEIVVTDLYSHEAPFIRYATGDIAAFTGRPCPCGRALPLLDRIEGRANDLILTPDGRAVNSLALVYAVREVEGIEQYRICQRSLDTFHMRVVRNASYRTEGEERIRTAWSKLFRTPVHVTFEYLAQLPVERSGKHRHVVSELEPAQLYGSALEFLHTAAPHGDGPKETGA